MPETTMRRVPRQDRAQRRLESILDAAEAVLMESGFSALSTNAIAERAGASIGTLYQFFPNKEAIVTALAERYLNHMRAALGLVRGPNAAGLGVEEWIDRAVDGLVTTGGIDPGFKLLFCDPGISPDLAEADAVLQQQTFQGVVDALAGWRPDLPADQHRRHAMIGIAVVKAILPLMHEHDDPNAVLHDLKSLLRSYLMPTYGTTA